MRARDGAEEEAGNQARALTMRARDGAEEEAGNQARALTMRARRDNLVSYPDHALFRAARSADLDAVIQVFWHYQHPIELEPVRRFHANFGHGLMGRRIERSVLPFGRLRWIASPGPQCDLDIAESPRPSAELFDFADEQLDLPLDPESGPAWRLAMQSFTDGSTVVS